MTEIKPGIYEGMSFPDYHAIEAVSASGLGKLKQSPAHLRAYLDEEYEETPALRMGRIIHLCVLEPKRWEEAVTKLGDCTEIKKSDDKPCANPATGVYAGTQLCGTHSRGMDPDEDVKTVTDAEWQTAMGIRRSIKISTVARKMLYTEGRSELTLIWKEERTGLLCKARVDRHSPEVPRGAFVDLKTTRSADRHSFSNAIFNYSYHLQGFHYLKGAEVLGIEAGHFVFVAAEKTVPYCHKVYKLHNSMDEHVEGQLIDLYHLWSRCVETDRWPGYTDVLQGVSIPGWATEKIELEREYINTHLRNMKDE